MNAITSEKVAYLPGAGKAAEINICLDMYIPDNAALCQMHYPEGMPTVWTGNPQDFILMPISGGKPSDAQFSFKDEFLANCSVINLLLATPVPNSWCNKRIVILGSEYVDRERQKSFFVTLSVDDSGNLEVGKQMKDDAVSTRSYVLVHK